MQDVISYNQSEYTYSVLEIHLQMSSCTDVNKTEVGILHGYIEHAKVSYNGTVCVFVYKCNLTILYLSEHGDVSTRERNGSLPRFSKK